MSAPYGPWGGSGLDAGEWDTTVDLGAVARDHEAIEILRRRAALPTLEDPALALLAALTADVDAEWERARPRQPDAGTRPVAPATAPPPAAAGQAARRSTGRGRQLTRGAVGIAVAGSILSVSGVAAAVGDDPLSPYTRVIASVTTAAKTGIAQLRQGIGVSPVPLPDADASGAGGTEAELQPAARLVPKPFLTPSAEIQAEVSTIEAQIAAGELGPAQEKLANLLAASIQPFGLPGLGAAGPDLYLWLLQARLQQAQADSGGVPMLPVAPAMPEGAGTPGVVGAPTPVVPSELPPAPVPGTGPTTGPVPDPSTGPTTGPVPDPSTGPTTGPVPDPSTGPSTGPTTGPVPDSTTGPTTGPSTGPTTDPTTGPTEAPGGNPAPVPTDPAPSPTDGQTEGPTTDPDPDPTEEPTEQPTEQPTGDPTGEPQPTDSGTEEPTEDPDGEPDEEPTEEPSETPSDQPDAEPSEQPDAEPTGTPGEGFAATSDAGLASAAATLPPP